MEATVYPSETAHVSQFESALALFEQTSRALRGDAVHEAMYVFYYALGALRAQLAPDDWLGLGAILRQHRLHLLLQHSPILHQALETPPGYPGDARLTDLIYGCGSRPTGLTTLGEALYAWEFETPGCRSLRHRRLVVAREIDRVVRDRGTASVLSVACGHLREVELSAAFRERRVRMTAVDLDNDTVAQVARDYGAFGVTARVGTALDVIRRGWAPAPFDLAYAAGHYECMDDQRATALTTTLFSTLAPGGRLLLSNVTPDARDAGYREACLDWRLIHRNGQQLEALLNGIPPGAIDSTERFRGVDGDIAYVRVVKR